MYRIEVDKEDSTAEPRGGKIRFMAIGAQFKRGVAAIRAHPFWSTVGGLGLYGVLDHIGQWQTGFGLMALALGPSWLAAITGSPWFAAACAAVILFSIWRIGRLTLAEEQQAAAELSAHTASERDLLIAGVRAAISDEGKLVRLISAVKYHQLRLDALERLIHGASAVRDRFVEEISKLQSQDGGRRATGITMGADSARGQFAQTGIAALNFPDLKSSLASHFPPKFKTGTIVLSEGTGLGGHPAINAFRPEGNEEWFSVQMYNRQLMDNAIAAAEETMGEVRRAHENSVNAVENYWSTHNG